MNPGSQVGAFFDVDGTLLAAPSLEWRFITFLLARDKIGGKQIGRWAAHCARMIRRKPRAAAEVIKGANKFYLAGLPESLATDWENSLARNSRFAEKRPTLGGRSFSSDIGHPLPSGVSTPEAPSLTFCANGSAERPSLPVFAEGLERIAWHSARGHRIFLVTGTIEPLARAFARLLARSGLACSAEVCSTQLETRGGFWTGRIAGQHGSGREKAKALSAFAAQYGLALSESFAYGDSFADLPMLETVGHPVAVNPKARLARITQRRGWAVRHWRSLHSDEAAAQSRALASEEAK